MFGIQNFGMIGMNMMPMRFPMMSAGVSMGASLSLGGLQINAGMGMGIGMDALSLSPTAAFMVGSPLGTGFQSPMMGMMGGMGMVPQMMPSTMGMQNQQMLMMMMQLLMMMMLLMEQQGINPMMGCGIPSFGYPISMSGPGMGIPMAGIPGMGLTGLFGSPIGMAPQLPFPGQYQGFPGNFPAIQGNPNVQIPNFGPNASKAQIGQMLDAAAQKYGIPPDILKAVAWQESGWRANASSFDGGHGKGVMQIDDRFHQFARTADVWDPAKNIDYGARYLADLYRKTGSWQEALRRYNGGSSYPPKIFAHAQNRPWTRYV